MTKDEAIAELDRLKAAANEARKIWEEHDNRYRESIREIGLISLGLKPGDVVIARGKRYSVTHARPALSWRPKGHATPAAKMIKKDGTVGERDISEWDGWVLEAKETSDDA